MQDGQHRRPSKAGWPLLAWGRGGWGTGRCLALWATATFGGLRKPSPSLTLFPKFLRLQTVGNILSLCSGLKLCLGEWGFFLD